MDLLFYQWTLTSREPLCVQVPLSSKQSVASSPVQDILSEFAGDHDAVSKVQLLVKYARMAPRMSESEKTAGNRVMGCTTQVPATLSESGQDAGSLRVLCPLLQRYVPSLAVVVPSAARGEIYHAAA